MLRCLFVASEVEGFAETGGLGDVAAALPHALAECGVDIAVVMPLYREVRAGSAALERLEATLHVRMGTRTVAGELWRGRLPESQVPIYFIAQPDYFERDDASQGRGLYQHVGSGGQTLDYPDNGERFGFFCRAVLEALPLLEDWPEIVHVNDWQTGLVPVYLKEVYRHHLQSRLRARYAQVRSVMTIHNLAYQGLLAADALPLLGLPSRLYHFEKLEFYDQISMLKGGLVYADYLTTVSPTYAREIQTPYFGCGLQGVLMQRGSRLRGIVNGVDYLRWNPAVDQHLPRRYDTASVVDGKAACKAALQEELKLAPEPGTPLLGMVARLIEQKGVELVEAVLPALVAERGVQLVLLGAGDQRHRELLGPLETRFPGRVRTIFTWNEPLAHRIQAGGDMFLMPSQYEPCGLSQLYSLKYGTIPVVRATGGLADTVADATPENLAARRATGFVFVPYTAPAFRAALERCLAVFRDDPQQWRALQEAGMSQDWSWARSAAEYAALYARLVGELASGGR